jgi:predicted metal-binding protein
MVKERLRYTEEQLREFEESWRRLSKKIEIADVAGPVKIAPTRLEDTPKFKPSIWPSSKEVLEKNLKKYIKLAMDLGAADAKAVRGKDVPLDLRALFVTCFNPNCRWLDSSANCPRHAFFPIEKIREYLSAYEFAVVYKVLSPNIEEAPDVGPIKLDKFYAAGEGEPPDTDMLARNIIRLRILQEMNRRIRQAVYYDGYMMTASIGDAPCVVTKCAKWGNCSALAKGGHCRFVDTSPSGPAAYVDYYKLARNLGWGELQLGGNCAFPEDVPEPDSYYNIGVVLVE